MQATRIVVERTGGPDVLRTQSISLPPPGSVEVRVRQTAVGVNFIDTYHRSGLYPLPHLPHGIGVEAAGVVESVGDGVEHLSVGDRVAYATAGVGAYASHRNVEAASLVNVPDGVSDEQAAATLLKGLTVRYLIRDTFPVEPGQTVLWHAAAGGVGVLACQWLRHLGVKVIGTVGSSDKLSVAREAGCSEVLLSSSSGWVQRVRELTRGEGVPVVYDSVGRATFADSLECLAPRGLMVSFGNASGPPEPFDVLRLAAQGSLFLTRPKLADYARNRPELTSAAQELFDLLARKLLRPSVAQRVPLAEAERAHVELEARRTTGSTVLLT